MKRAALGFLALALTACASGPVGDVPSSVVRDSAGAAWNAGKLVTAHDYDRLQAENGEAPAADK
jgi:hypothetical protein